LSSARMNTSLLCVSFDLSLFKALCFFSLLSLLSSSLPRLSHVVVRTKSTASARRPVRLSVDRRKGSCASVSVVLQSASVRRVSSDIQTVAASVKLSVDRAQIIVYWNCGLNSMINTQ
ncbi:hypothetical protein PENTCL1PPCAC_16127, partial [Pristionchus entomophagus]